MKLNRRRALLVTLALPTSIAATAAIALASPGSGATTRAPVSQALEQHPDQVLEWNQIFIDTLIATNTRNSSSQRLGAIVHTAVFDAYNGIERRYIRFSFMMRRPPARRAEQRSSQPPIRRWWPCFPSKSNR
jgi:hypothetical protein